MAYEVVVEHVEAEWIAAVRVTVRLGEVGQAWGPALDQVWAVLRARPEVIRGHNCFLYHHPASRGEPMQVDFGVQVAQPFEAVGAVRCIETPAGEVATAVHLGPYDQLAAAHEAIHAWCASNNRRIGGASWEIIRGSHARSRAHRDDR